jgi:hypothetical protein
MSSSKARRIEEYLQVVVSLDFLEPEKVADAYRPEVGIQESPERIAPRRRVRHAATCPVLTTRAGKSRDVFAWRGPSAIRSLTLRRQPFHKTTQPLPIFYRHGHKSNSHPFAGPHIFDHRPRAHSITGHRDHHAQHRTNRQRFFRTNK